MKPQFYLRTKLCFSAVFVHPLPRVVKGEGKTSAECIALQVNVGMFDQSFRVVGCDETQVFSCVTRNNVLTETFIRHLMTVLSGVFPTPTPEDPPSTAQSEDFYKMFNKYGRSESLSFSHPSRVRSVRQNQELHPVSSEQS